MVRRTSVNQVVSKLKQIYTSYVNAKIKLVLAIDAGIGIQTTQHCSINTTLIDNTQVIMLEIYNVRLDMVNEAMRDDIIEIDSRLFLLLGMLRFGNECCTNCVTGDTAEWTKLCAVTDLDTGCRVEFTYTDDLTYDCRACAKIGVGRVVNYRKNSFSAVLDSACNGINSQNDVVCESSLIQFAKIITANMCILFSVNGTYILNGVIRNDISLTSNIDTYNIYCETCTNTSNVRIFKRFDRTCFWLYANNFTNIPLNLNVTNMLHKCYSLRNIHIILKEFTTS